MEVDAGRMDVSEDHILLMNVPDATAKLPKNRHDLPKAERSLAEGLPGGNVVWRLAGELEESSRHLVVEILQTSREIQEVGVVQLAELLCNLSRKLLFLFPECGKVNQSDQLYLG